MTLSHKRTIRTMAHKVRKETKAIGRRLSDKWVSQRGSPRQANNTFEPELRGIRSDTAAEMAAHADDDGGAPSTHEHAVQDVLAGAPNQVSWGENNEHAQQVSNPIAAPSSQQALGTAGTRHAEI